MILGRPPDPGDVPEDPTLLLGRQTPMHLLDHLASRGRHDEPHLISGASEVPNRCRRKISARVERVTLAKILESNGEYDDQPTVTGASREVLHRAAVRAHSPMLRIRSNRGSA